MESGMAERKLIRVEVDANLCVGSGMCVNFNPDKFSIQSDGHAAYVAEELDEPAALDAAELCPVSAIKLVYDDET
jgi:ferredoxin